MLLQRDERRGEQMDLMKDSIGNLTDALAPLAAKVTEMEPDVEHYRTIRGKIVWVGSAIMTGAGLLGGAASDWVLRKFTES